MSLERVGGREDGLGNVSKGDTKAQCKNWWKNCEWRTLPLREVVKTSTLEQDSPNHKIVGGVCLHPPCLRSKDGVFIV